MGSAGLRLVAVDDAARHEPRLRDDDARPRWRNSGGFRIIRCLGPTIGPGWRASQQPRPARARQRRRRSAIDARARFFRDTRRGPLGSSAAVSRLCEILERLAPTFESERSVAGAEFLLATGAANRGLGSDLDILQYRGSEALSEGAESILRRLTHAADR